MAKKTKKKPHSDDLLIQITKKIESFITRYFKIILASISAIIVVSVIYFSVSFVLSKREKSANSAFGKVYLIYSTFIDDKKDTPLDVSDEELSSVIESFQNIIKNYPKSDAACKSAYFLGNIFYKVAEYERAADYYSKGYAFDKKSSTSMLCLQGEASSYEQMEEYEQAIERYITILEGFKQSYIIPTILFTVGQIHEKQNQLEKANEQYTQITTSYQWSSWKEYAEKRILYLKNLM